MISVLHRDQTDIVSSTETIVVRIEGKERIVESDGKNPSSYWIVFTDTEVFKNTDSLYYMKFNSSDIQGRLKIGSTCKIKVNGFRVHGLSMYRNIISVDECK